jgi:hypothetical protein
MTRLKQLFTWIGKQWDKLERNGSGLLHPGGSWYVVYCDAVWEQDCLARSAPLFYDTANHHASIFHGTVRRLGRTPTQDCYTAGPPSGNRVYAIMIPSRKLISKRLPQPVDPNSIWGIITPSTAGT